MTHKRGILLVVIAMALWSLACDDTWKGFKKDTQENTAEARRQADESGVDEAAKDVADKARTAAGRAKEELEKAAAKLQEDDAPAAPGAAPSTEERAGTVQDKAKALGREIADEAQAATIHLSVKQALVRDDTIDASHINVDVRDDERTIVLRGSVPTLEQKASAERIARERSRGYAVQNQLTVMGR
jgi:osmotically-inducible protein OsmY